MDLTLLFSVLDILQSDAVFIASADDENKIIYANKNALEILKRHSDDINKEYGYNLDFSSVVGLSIHKFHKNPDNVRKLLKALKPGQIEKNADIKVGNMLIESYRSAIFDKNNNPVYYITIWKDVSTNVELEKTKQEKNTIERLSKFNRLLGEINTIVHKEQSEYELFQKICEFSVEYADLGLAWIGKPDDAGKVNVLTSYGIKDCLEDVFISIDPSIPEGRGPVGKAWREGLSVYVENFVDSPDITPWKEKAKKHNIKVSASIPIFKNKEIYAIYNIYDFKLDRFDEELKHVIESIAKAIGYGLENIEKSKKEKALSNLNEALIENTMSGIIIVRYPERIIEYSNKRFAEMLGYQDQKELIGKSMRELYDSEETYKNIEKTLVKEVFQNGSASEKNITFKHKNGYIIHLDKSGKRLEQENKIVWTLVYVEDRYRLEKELEKQAITDELTGLPNRRALDIELKKAINRSDRNKKLFAVAMLDLDGFKYINDTYGHDVGDKTIKIIANRLSENLRNIDFISRLGGDEFVVIIDSLDKKDDIFPVLHRIEDIINIPIELSANENVSLGVSIGVAIHYPGQENSSTDMLKKADIALYKAKANKENRLNSYVIYGETPSIKLNKYQNLLHKERVEVLYQPIVDLREKKVLGVEALARLKDEDDSIISPGIFLNHLNESDIFKLNSIVMSKALKDIDSLKDINNEIYLSINVDPRSISDRCLECVDDKLKNACFNPNRITFEILEVANFQENALNYIYDLKELGLKIALDDLGSAYSSLLRIKQIPVDKIKLDQAFVRNLDKKPDDLMFVYSISILAESIGVDLVVEGVETKDILDAIMSLGIRYAQGFYIARPMDINKLKEFLQKPLDIPSSYPTTILGVYAKSIIYHNDIIKLMGKDSYNVYNINVPNYKECPIHKSLVNILGYEDSTLNNLHDEYHTIIAKYMNNGKDSSKNLEHLNKLYKDFQNYLIYLYNSNKN